MPSLSECVPGEQVRVISIQQVERSFRHQLATLGVKRDQVIYVKRVAPLGDPICLEIEGALLALRRAECEEILVEYV
jgi:ferrous iron transport protein A